MQRQPEQTAALTSLNVGLVAGVAWYSAQDRNGRTYYYEENGNESCWQLPSVSQTIQVLGTHRKPNGSKHLTDSVVGTWPAKLVGQIPLKK